KQTRPGCSPGRGGEKLSCLPELPGGLGEADDLADVGEATDLVAAKAELPVHRVRTARRLATIAEANLRGVARQLLQLDEGFHHHFRRSVLVLDGLLVLFTTRLVLLVQLGALVVAGNNGSSGHARCSVL